MGFGKGFIVGVLATLGGLLSAEIIKEQVEKKQKMDDDELYNLKDAKVTNHKDT
jgi:hypothetical protein